MCRFIAYIGKPLIIHAMLFEPENSLINQSTHAKEMPEPLNGDGFGLGWYVPEIDSEPGLFKSINPAWNDQNLKHLSKKIQSPCFFAHVRSASKGAIAQYNCHPFQYEDWLFMHNGTIFDFELIRRDMCHPLSDKIYNWIKGQTDSEHLFALLLERMQRNHGSFDPKQIPHYFGEVIAEINTFKAKRHITSNTYINAVLTNGKSMIAIRYSADPENPPLSLHYNVGSQFSAKENYYHILPPVNDKNEIVVISSEPLTTFEEEWIDLPSNYFLMVSEDLSTTIQPLNIPT
ncbi:MAG: class II glutamine amidotransferase [Candidatus Berkiella sp.]